jgi:hypothetical protein
MCLNEIYSRFRLDKNLSDMFTTRNVSKQGDVLALLLSKSALEYAFRRVHGNQDGLKLNGTH